MSAVTVEKSQANRRSYSSPASALIWRFRDSRDNWKRKYQEVKAELHRTRRRLDRVKASQQDAPVQQSVAVPTQQPVAAPIQPVAAPVQPVAAPVQPVAPPSTATPRPDSSTIFAQILDEIRQSHLLLQELSEIRQEGERQLRSIVEMTQQMQTLMRPLPPEQLLSSPPPGPLPTAERLLSSPPPGPLPTAERLLSSPPPGPLPTAEPLLSPPTLPHTAPGAKKRGPEPSKSIPSSPTSSQLTAKALTSGGASHRFPSVLVDLSLALVTEASVPLRATVRILDVVSQALKLDWHIPHWTTVRNWLLRTGLARFRHGLQTHDDWVVLTDHSVQIGTEKCLVSLGIRQSEYQKLDRPLTLRDATLLGLEVMPRSTKKEVHQVLDGLSETVGDPQGVVHDQGSDLAAGVRLLQKQKPEVQSIVDCKHKAACLLKKRLHADPRWKELQTRAGQSKTQLQQTELAWLAPPSQRTKARYMNMDKLVRWGEKTLAVLDGKLALPAELKRERAQEKLGWLQDYREDLKKCKGWLETIEVVVTHVGWHGLRETTAKEVQEKLGQERSQSDLGQELLAFVKEQSKGLKGEERMPGSTEVVETCMGKLKRLEGEQSKGGFTGLLLGLGAVIGKKDDRPAHQWLSHISTKEVNAWIKTNLGVTVQAARRHLALAFRSSQQKSSRRSSPNLLLT